jgi:small glutamine-rich tetratricopeptide repeat-containing protein alpha
VKEKLKEAPAAMPGMPGGMPDFSNMGAAMEQMMQNPQMRQMAENMMQNPQMQGMMQNMMGQMGMPMPPMGGEEGGAPAGLPAGFPDMGAGLPDMGAGGGFNPGTVKIRF